MPEQQSVEDVPTAATPPLVAEEVISSHTDPLHIEPWRVAAESSPDEEVHSCVESDEEPWHTEPKEPWRTVAVESSDEEHWRATTESDEESSEEEDSLKRCPCTMLHVLKRCWNQRHSA